MNESIANIFEIIKSGKYGFESMIAFFTDLWKSAIANEHIVSVNEWFGDVLAPVLPYLFYFFLGFFGVVWLFGKRLFGFFRFIAFFLVGFVLGIYYLGTPVITHFPSVPAWVVGITVGLVLGLLGRVLYYLVYGVVAGYGTYLLCVSGMLLPEIKGNYTVGLIVSAVVLVLLLVIHGFVERFGTAFLGAYCMLYIVVHFIYDFTAPVLTFLAFIPEGFEWTVLVGSAFILAIPGFAVQQKMKKKKY